MSGYRKIVLPYGLLDFGEIVLSYGLLDLPVLKSSESGLSTLRGELLIGDSTSFRFEQGRFILERIVPGYHRIGLDQNLIYSSGWNRGILPSWLEEESGLYPTTVRSGISLIPWRYTWGKKYPPQLGNRNGPGIFPFVLD